MAQDESNTDQDSTLDKLDQEDNNVEVEQDTEEESGSEESQDEEPAPVTDTESDDEEPQPVTQQSADTGAESDSSPNQAVGVRAGENTVTEEAFEQAGDEEKKSIGMVYEDDKSEIREKLEQQPKVMMNIPNDTDEEHAYHNVQINGYRLKVKKGVMVEVPKQVAELLADHFDIQHNLGKDLNGENYRLDDADEETKKALS